MLGFISAILNLVLSIARSKRSLICENALLKKELEILKRRDTTKKVMTNGLDRLLIVLLSRIASIRNRVSIVRPETVLRWQRDLIRRFWTFKRPYGKKGRKPVARHIRELILEMNNDNILWGVKRIQGELTKLDIFLDTKTIWNILRHFRRLGKVRTGMSWRKFLEMRARSIYAMDLFTVDTILNRRFCVHFIISHATREIVQFAITENPIREFVRQQIIEFESTLKGTAFLIHDCAPQFFLDYASCGITGIRTSVRAPNRFHCRKVCWLGTPGGAGPLSSAQQETGGVDSLGIHHVVQCSPPTPGAEPGSADRISREKQRKGSEDADSLWTAPSLLPEGSVMDTIIP